MLPGVAATLPFQPMELTVDSLMERYEEAPMRLAGITYVLVLGTATCCLLAPSAAAQDSIWADWPGNWAASVLECQPEQ